MAVPGKDDWMQPGAHPVAEGVFRIPLPLPNDGLRAVNVYAITHANGPVLVDSGWAIPEARVLLADCLREIGFSLGDVRRFLITHIHRDHYTQAIAIRQEFGTRVTLGADERDSLELAMRPGRAPIQEQIELLRALGAVELSDLLTKYMHQADRHEWELPDDWFTDGEVVDVGDRQLDVLETPGHTRGHVVFHDTPGGLLFAGDHVLPTITPSIGFEPGISPDPLGDFLRSLALVRARPDARLLPAHGPVTASVHDRVDELVEHHRIRLDQSQDAVASGAVTAYDVACKLRWTRRERTLDEMDPFNQFLAVTETAAHLDLLVAQGKLTRTNADDPEATRQYAVA